MSSITPENKNFLAKASVVAKIVVYLSFLLIIPAIWFIVARNGLISLQQSIEETASGIDIQLKRRFDLLTKLVDATKGYMKFEKETLTQVTALRKNATNIDDLSKVNSSLNNAFSGFNAVLENYPDLKANTNVLNLQSAARDCEDNIAAARRFYNANVKEFNSRLLTFPSNVAATSLHLVSKDYFLTTAEEREDVKVSFS